ncbi:aminodeoxychorismate synthase component I [Arthrobacter crusticola]|uniref:aminodeoxychorismate synthase n=1 Tax=Arthrobacter crusticola TaxID=2547960 RepID=A0A4R5TWB7_9MICC|nr:aminodeoxychorismate synthase component I [Arthrobacter crusticola]TDK25402.1 aminodeoxychorismate synthase component I [Arthrobacter crusticola]
MEAHSGRAGVPLILAVDGRSGAGKTTLAVELAALLREHHRVSLFHLEEIYPGWDGLAGGLARYVESVLRPLAAGGTATWHAWDWERGTDGPLRRTEPAEIVLVEGVGASCAAARPYLDAALWVEAPDDVRRTSALTRDGDTFAPFWQRWAEQELAWLAQDDPAGNADLIVQGHRGLGTPHEVRLALSGLPRWAAPMSPERAGRRGLQVHAERLEHEPSTPEVFAGLYGSSPSAVWLDSSDAAETTAPERSRFTILADDGGRYGQSVRHRAGLTEVTAGAVTARIPGQFFRWLDGVWGRGSMRAPAGYECGFALGWLGYLGYELKRETGGASLPAAPLPDAALIFAGRAVVVDHQQQCTFLLTLGDGTADPECGRWLDTARVAVLGAPAPGSRATRNPAPPRPSPVFTARDTRAGYLGKIKESQAEIGEGNTYEVCLTTALEARLEGTVNPLPLYLALREANPAPFAHLLRFPGAVLASTSPERFLRLDADGFLRAEPIKGTRRRSADPVEDEALRRDLAASLKDRAENIMIVDLLRNDLSHFAVPGSVTVSRLCAIESYATVHQMVSTIDARLRPGSSRAEAVSAAFPAGSMTGAPKISTMALLDRLENAPRGAYSGAAGYFSLTGAADLAVVIRTLVLEDDDGATRVSLGVGGAITADSVPAEEWEEVRTKAFGVLSALGSRFPD